MSRNRAICHRLIRQKLGWTGSCSLPRRTRSWREGYLCRLQLLWMYQETQLRKCTYRRRRRGWSWVLSFWRRRCHPWWWLQWKSWGWGSIVRRRRVGCRRCRVGRVLLLGPQRVRVDCGSIYRVPSGIVLTLSSWIFNNDLYSHLVKLLISSQRPRFIIQFWILLVRNSTVYSFCRNGIIEASLAFVFLAVYGSIWWVFEAAFINKGCRWCFLDILDLQYK